MSAKQNLTVEVEIANPKEQAVSDAVALRLLARRERDLGFTNYADWLDAGCPDRGGDDQWEYPQDKIDDIRFYLASHPLEQHTFIIGQSCPPHVWAHSPTVGSFDCVKCRERVNYDDPRYAGLLADRESGKRPLEQQQAVSGGVVERMAKAIFFRGPPVDESIWQLLDPLTIKAYRQQAQAALTASGVGRMRSAAQALIDDVRRRYPGEELRCPLMIELDTALQDNDGGMEGG